MLPNATKTKGRPREFHYPLGCKCGYSTNTPAHYRQHAVTCTVAKPIDTFRVSKESTEESLRRINEDNQGNEISFLRKQLQEKDKQLHKKDRQIQELMQILHTKEIRERDKFDKEPGNDTIQRKRKSRKSSSRPNLTEPQRRAIAKRQNWKCNNPHGVCNLPGELAGYDIDHVIPRWKNGSDHPDNLQALCPGCHRFKTDHERIDREAWESLCDRLEALPDP